MVRRSINWPFLLITTTVFIAVGVGAYFVRGWQLGRTAEALLRMADAKEKEKDWAKAAELLDRYLRLRPADGETRGRLALVYSEGAKSRGEKELAVDLLYRALAAGPTNKIHVLRARLAGLLLDTFRFKEAENEAKRLLEGREDPQAMRFLAIALMSQLADGSLAAMKTEEVGQWSWDKQTGVGLVKTIETAQRLNPTDSKLAMLLAALYREYPLVIQAEYPGMTEPQRMRQADECMDRLVRDNAESADAHLARYSYRIRYGSAEAQSDLQTALRLSPENPDVLLAAAVNAFNQGITALRSEAGASSGRSALEQSKVHYEQLLAYCESNEDYEHRIERVLQSYVGLGDVWLALGDVDQAIEAWRQGLKQPSPPTALIPFHSRIAEACLNHDRLSTAQQELDAIDLTLVKLGGSISRDSKFALTRAQDLRRAFWHIKRGEVADAITLLRQVVLSQPKGDANVELTIRAWQHLGTLYSSLGEWLDAASAFDQASNLDLSLLQPRVAAATMWLYAGRPDVAGERAEQAVKQASSFEAWSALALAQLQLQSSFPVEQRSWTRLEEALAALDQIAKQAPGSTRWQVEFIRAEYCIAKAKAANDVQRGIGEAVRVLRKAEERYSQEREFWAQACLAYERFKLNDEADRALEQVRRLEGSPADVAVLRSRLASARGNFEMARTELSEVVNLVPSHDQQRLRQELLRVAIASRDEQQARAILLQDHERNPKNLSTIRRLAELDLERRDLDSVAKWESKLQSAGLLGEPLARYFRSSRVLLASAGQNEAELQAALRDLEQVILAKPNWADAASLKGMIEQRLGHIEQALADYERAVQLGERRLIILEQLIGLLDRLHRSADVDRYLAQMQAEIPLSQRLAELAAAQEIRRERPDQALEIARRRVAQGPKDALAQLWLARLLMVANETGEAERAFLKAAELAPEDARVWSGLLAYYIRTGNREQIETTLHRVEQNTGLAAAQRSLLSGEAHEALGHVDQAKRSYAQAAETKDELAIQLRVAQFYMKTDAQQAKLHLEEALRIDPKSEAAKKMLAIVQASLGELDKAMSLLTAVTDGVAAGANDIRLQALLLMQQGGEANIARAISLLEQVSQRESEREQMDHLLLAHLYEHQARVAGEDQAIQDHVESAERQLMTLAQSSNAEPTHLATLIQFLTRHGKREQATTWLVKLESLVDSRQPDDSNTLALVVQAQLIHQSAARSETWLQRLEKIEPLSLRTVALRTQVMAALDARDIEAFVEQKAPGILEQAKTPEELRRLYARIGDIYQGVKLFSAAERWYRKLVAEDPKQFPALAGALVRQGRIAETILLCEQIATTDSTSRPATTLAASLVEGHPSAENFQRAEPILTAAVTKFPGDAQLLYATALFYVVQKKDDEAAALFRKVVAINPRSVAALNNLAMLLAEKASDRSEALRLIDQAIEIAGKQTGLLDTKAAILLYSGRSAEAVPLLRLATRDSQADPRHHFHLAVAYRDQGNMDQAKQQLQIALERRLDSHVLTATDERLLSDLRAAFQL
jgi:tetratricopeptide (TPR) repeat protein